MGDAYEAGRSLIEELATWYEGNKGNRNEATTRLAMIDRLFFDCLGWLKDDVVLEQPHGGEYADYVFSVFRPVLIVEAKREGDYFELPAGSHRLEHSLQSLIKDYPNVKSALEQATRYCQSRGVPFGAVTNGHQIIAFVATRSDGTPPLSGKALVFDSLSRMREDFLDLWQVLSRPGIEERKLQRRLMGGFPIVPAKLSAKLSGYPGLKLRNVIQTDLQLLSEIVIEDVARSPDLEAEFLRQCYCKSGALSQFALTSREILEARYAGLFDRTEHGPYVAPATTKAGVSPDLLGTSIARRPILLLGDVGVGKSSFIRHLINIDAPEVFKNAIYFHLDLGSKGALALDLRVHVVDEIARQLFEDHRIDPISRNFVRGVYDLELKRFASGIYADLKQSSPDDFLQKEIAYLDGLVSMREAHLRSSLQHIARARRKQVILFLDNADQRDEKTQELAFLIGQELAESWPMLVFIALRPETFHRSKKIGALTGYHAKAFSISPPRIDLVLQKRLEFALKLTTGQIPVPSLQCVGVNLAKLTSMVSVVKRSLERNEQLLEFIENIASGNVRLALDLIKDFIGSGHVNTQKILAMVAEGEEYTIPLHEFLRAIIYGDNEYYDPSTSPIVNLFDITSLDGKGHFLLPLMLGILHGAGSPLAKEGFLETDKLYDALQGMGFLPDQIDLSVSRACEKNLVETNQRTLPEPGQTRPPAMRITSKGEYHFQRLTGEFQYLDAVVVDTPILYSTDSGNAIFDAKTMEDRLVRAERFLKYLTTHWASIHLQGANFNWYVESSSVTNRISAIRRSMS